jgi:putative oxidoreductase
MTPKIILTWFLRVALAIVFALSAFQKYSGDPQYISEFAKVGFGDWLRTATAVLETLGVIGVLWPRTTSWGAGVLLSVTMGALIAQLTVLHVGWLHCAIIGAGLIALIGLTVTERRPASG